VIPECYGFTRIIRWFVTNVPRDGDAQIAMTQSIEPRDARHPRYRSWDDRDEREEAPIAPLTREEARVLREREPSISPWRVVAVQAIAGVVVALVAWVLSGRSSVAWSALYGAGVVVVPTAVLARGMGRLSGWGPVAGAVGFLVWEGVKVFLAVAMLLAAGRVVPDLSWPALLVAMIVCLKVNWVALLWRGRGKNDVVRR